MTSRMGRVVSALALGAFVSCGDGEGFRPPEELGVGMRDSGATLDSENVAVIVNSKCATCHHRDGVGPFPLRSVSDFTKRRRQILEVITSGYMPPWPPTSGYNRFKDERGLDSVALERLADWLERGCPESEFDANQIGPEPDGSLVLGPPDLLLNLEEPYVLSPDATDVFRSFVIRAPVDKPTFVRGFDFLPSTPRAAHHLVFEIDNYSASRDLDAADPIPGFDGMLQGNSANPVGGQFFGWSPGRAPFFTLPGMQWRLDPGVDIVLRLHLQSTGKLETIAPQLALYTTEEEPMFAPNLVWLTTGKLNIRPGAKRHTSIASKVFREDTYLFSVYPHAHYLCQDIMIYSESSDGLKRWLLRIDRWDFNWQGEYRYQEPIRLSAGSRVFARFRYDNSRDNPLNPNSPPKRVMDGPLATDEMGDVWFVSLPASVWDNKKDER